MRSLLLVTLVALSCVLAMATAVPIDESVMAAPQFDADVSMLQTSESSTVQSASVAAIESQLAAAQKVEQELQTQVDSAVDTDSDSESESEVDSDSDAELDSESDSDADLDSDSDSEADVDSESETDSESVDALEAEFEAQAEAEVDAAESQVDQRARSHLEVSVDKSGKAAAKKAEKKAKKAAKKAAKKERKNRGSDAPKRKRFSKRGEKKVLSAIRSNPKGTPDVVTIPGRRDSELKLYKTWVVNPNMRLEAPAPKKVLVHSKERVMTAGEGKKLSTIARIRTPRRLSAVRRAFLRLNPDQRASKLRARAFSPSAALYRAFRAGRFDSLKFDPPTGSSVVQHVTIHSHAPSVRQRAEVGALRAASRTLRRITSKSREFKRALRALRQARKTVQKQIHAHHVLKAVQAKKVAARAARRAAWSTLLQHRRLRRTLMKTLSKTLGSGNLVGAARRQAIVALLREQVSGPERARLHAFIKGGNTRRRRAVKAIGGNTTKSASAATRVVKAIGGTTTKSASAATRVVKAIGGATTKSASAATRVVKSVLGDTKQSGSAAVRAVKTAAGKAKLSKKDANAVQALIKRIRAAINHPDTKAAAGGAKKTKKAKAAAAATKAAPAAPAVGLKLKTVKAVGGDTKTSKSAAVRPTNGKVTPVRFSQVSLEAAEAAAAEAEQQALADLNVENEVDSVEDVMMQTRAQVEAATETTDEFIKAHTV